MKRYSILLIRALMLFVSIEAVDTMPKFQPKLQIGDALSIDKLQEQNLNIVQKAVEGIGENLPQRVDDHTKLVDVNSNGTMLIYTFEVFGGPQSDTALKEQGKGMVPRIRQGICFSSKRFLQADITLRYRYLSSATQKEILRVDVDKEQCQKIWNQPEN